MTRQSKQNSGTQGSNVSNVHFCTACKKPLRRIIDNTGPHWRCTGFPECKTTFYDVDGNPSVEADERYRCPVCTRPMVRTSNDRGVYWFCTGYKKGCTVTLPDDDGRPEVAYRCKRCGQLLVKRRGKNGEFWGCRAYPQCTSTYNDKDGMPDFATLTS
ncbi:MAG: topoisomerase DNA-binding C4 zinc finger domain-containing protein [Gammaproteobacteria bacterium]|nr:topoisomerase DNA-binding C4 zinc finger domain-containing protein [Gammaproteobacteria bacterium]